MKPPCKTCPWRVGSRADAIPGFVMEKAEGLRATCDRPTPRNHKEAAQALQQGIFACHLSRPEEEFPCSGWAARYGANSIALRLLVSMDRLDRTYLLGMPSSFPALYETYDAMMANLRETQ